METLMSTTIYTQLANATNGGRDLPAALTGRFKDIPTGTRALLTLLRRAKGKADMIHVAWRTMDHGQPSDVMTIDEAERHLRLV